MRKEYCTNHHYYDADKYASCPFCAKAGIGTEPKSDPKTELMTENVGKEKGKEKDGGGPKTGKSKWPWGKNILGSGKEPVSKTVQPHTGTGADITQGGGNQTPPEPATSQGQYMPPGSVPPITPPQPGGEPWTQPVSGTQPGGTPWTQPTGGTPGPQPGRGPQPGGGSSLQHDLGKVNKGNEPKTMSYWGNNFTDEPPVGWFACIGGPNVGSTYEIYSGKNGIGRKMAAENKIIIQQDAKISGMKHTTVMYDPKGRKFYLLPSEGNGMVYRNDEIVLNIMELSAHDILQIGDTSLMLIPLCGPDFTWEDWMKKSDE